LYLQNATNHKFKIVLFVNIFFGIELRSLLLCICKQIINVTLGYVKKLLFYTFVCYWNFKLSFKKRQIVFLLNLKYAILHPNENLILPVLRMRTDLILASEYFPSIKYVSQILKTETIFIEAKAQFAKHTFFNKCEIYAANGKLSLTVPIKKFTFPKVKMEEVEISYDTDWQRLHFKSIESAYRSSAFYEFYIDAFLPFFKKKYQYLLDFNTDLLKMIIEELEMDTRILLTSEPYKKQFDATNLSNEQAEFSNENEANSNSQFAYYQIFANKFGFIPNLSILDLLFNEGPNARGYLLKF